MRTSFVPVTSFYVMVNILLFAFTSQDSLKAQSLEDLSFSIISSCNAPELNRAAGENKFYITLKITEMKQGYDDFQVFLNRRPIAQFHVEETRLPFVRSIGPFDYSAVGGTYNEYILQSLNSARSDTMYIRELACGLSTNNGLNTAGYSCNRGSISVMAQTAPEAVFGPAIPDKTYVFVLLKEGRIMDKNFSGRFDNVLDLTEYDIHAYATTFETSASFISNLVIGEPLDQSNLDICFGLCGIYSVKTDCSSFDLALEKSVQGNFVVGIGDTIVFNITLINEGIVPAYNVVIRDFPPVGLQFVPQKSLLWNNDLTSLPITHINPGQRIVLPITFIVANSSTGIILNNVAEIIKAADRPNGDIVAFDKDSEPDNGIPEEDDQDEAEILILENFCSANFQFDMKREPLCLGASVFVRPEIIKAAPPLKYLWRFNQKFFSEDSVLFIANPQVANYGVYTLTIVDDMGCAGTRSFTIEPIINDDIIACYSDLVIGVGRNCKLDITPEMITRTYFSGREDYTIEARGPEGRILNLEDLSAEGILDVIEVRLVNPCNGAIKCWTRIKVSYDFEPLFKWYTKDVVTHCDYALNQSPTEIIDQYNTQYPDQIVTAQTFADSLNKNTCLREWEVEAIDVFLVEADMCRANVVARIYSTRSTGELIHVDTARLILSPMRSEELIFPKDLDNLSCDQGLHPRDISSFPLYVFHGDTVSLDGRQFENNGTAFCTMGIKFSDQYYTTKCLSATSKVIRSWSALDWCTNQVINHAQFLYVRDLKAPVINSTKDTLWVNITDVSCTGSIDIGEFIFVSDNCDPAPKWYIADPLMEGTVVSGLSIGHHQVILTAHDHCGNQALDSIIIVIEDNTPPVAILNQVLTVTLSSDQLFPVIIPAKSFDVGSHDGACGPVSLEIVRSSEFYSFQDGSITREELLSQCHNSGIADRNEDGMLTPNELLRETLDICCGDIQQNIPVLVRISDLSGNITDLVVTLEVVSKEVSTPCNDGNPCTINDVQTADCPCSGLYVYEDIDSDGMADCTQELFTICMAGIEMEVPLSQFNELISRGGVAGNCHLPEEVAMIAGEVYTSTGLMVDKVAIHNQQVGIELTDGKGSYAFDALPMYVDYRLTPDKNDDPLNGVTALDIVLIKMHILGIDLLTDPYQIIAADVNGDGKISALDILDLRRLLLGLTTEFPNNRSWRFVLEHFEFDDIRSPFPFRETNVIRALDKDMMDENWIAVKIGDVSNSVTTSKALSTVRKNGVAALKTMDKVYLQNEKIDITLSIPAVQPAIGVQYRLELKDIEVLSIESSSISLENGQYHFTNQPNRSMVTVVWYDESATSKGAVDITIKGRARRSVSASKAILLDSEYKSVVYDVLHNEFDLDLTFEALNTEVSSSHVKLYQNQPNPFNGYTLIQFELPFKGEVELIVSDALGQSVYTHIGNYNQGINAVNISRNDLRYTSGVLFYTIKFNGAILTKSMVNTFDGNR